MNYRDLKKITEYIKNSENVFLDNEARDRVKFLQKFGINYTATTLHFHYFKKHRPVLLTSPLFIEGLKFKDGTILFDRKTKRKYFTLREKLILNHELHEKEAAKNKFLRKVIKELIKRDIKCGYYTHFSPSVILKDHNLISSLNKNLIKNGKPHINFLPLDQIIPLKKYLPKKFKFGKSKRLSRSLIKSVDKKYYENIYKAHHIPIEFK